MGDSTYAPYDESSALERWRRQKSIQGGNKVAVNNTVAKQGVGANPWRLPDSLIKKTVEQHTASGPNDYGFGGGGFSGSPTRQGNDDIPASTYRDGPQPPSLMDQLIEAITQQYEPQARPDLTSQIAQYKQVMDNALNARLQGYEGIRNTAQGNFNTSNQNLADMFGANASNIAEQGSAAYHKITDEQKAGLTASRDSTVGAMQADRSKQIAERQAMLQALGIQGVGEAADPTLDTISNGINTVNQHTNTNLQMADNQGANNQAYNQSVVNSVNQQGAERRAALMQQLQGIFGKLDMAEADARTQNEQQKAQMELQAQQAAATAPDNSYGIFKDRQNNMLELWKSLNDQQLQREKMAQSGSTASQKVQGFSGLAQDLLNSGVDPNAASQYIGVLSNVLGSEYMKGVDPNQGYDRGSVIARRLMENGVPPVIAGQLATNYSNLGNNAAFTAQ